LAALSVKLILEYYVHRTAVNSGPSQTLSSLKICEIGGSHGSEYDVVVVVVVAFFYFLFFFYFYFLIFFFFGCDAIWTCR
jgi:hypothetical protein